MYQLNVKHVVDWEYRLSCRIVQYICMGIWIQQYTMQQQSEDDRRRQAQMIRKFHPDKIPILLNRNKSSKLKQFDNNKILILKSFTVFKLIMVIKKKLQINYSQAIYVFAGNTLLQADQTLQSVYDKYAANDKFLHLTYCQYATFGTYSKSVAVSF